MTKSECKGQQKRAENFRNVLAYRPPTGLAGLVRQNAEDVDVEQSSGRAFMRVARRNELQVGFRNIAWQHEIESTPDESGRDG